MVFTDDTVEFFKSSFTFSLKGKCLRFSRTNLLFMIFFRFCRHYFSHKDLQYNDLSHLFLDQTSAKLEKNEYSFQNSR